MSIEQAMRLPDVASDSDLPEQLDDARICYWRSPGGWWIYLPRGGIGRLTNHTVEEHADRSITVRPSIAMSRAAERGGGWDRHGFLTRGEWTEA